MSAGGYAGFQCIKNGVLDISTPDYASGEGAVKAEGGGVVCVTIDLKDRALAEDLYARFVGIIGDDYVKVLGFSEDELKKEDDIHKDGEWSINYLANFVSHTWGLDGGENTIYTLSINMLLRYRINGILFEKISAEKAMEQQG